MQHHPVIVLVLAMLLLSLGTIGASADVGASSPLVAATLPRLVAADATDRVRSFVRRIGPTSKLTQAAKAEPLSDYAFYPPTNPPTDRPMQILVVLHGMGGNGPDFAKPVLSAADANGWAVLAPTMPYRDYRDPDLVRRDGELLPRLKALIDALPERTGLQLEPRVLFFGFSRGSQESHRFSFMFPESTLGVAGMSAGSYTLPRKTFGEKTQEQALLYPYGIGDVATICGSAFDPEATRKVDYWIAVGGRDNRNDDVPRQFDRYLGINRVERAQGFVTALQQLGADASLTVYPGVGHEVTAQMQDDALRFLASLPAPTVSSARSMPISAR